MMIYVNYVHEHISQCVLVFMNAVGLHSAIQRCKEFEHVHDLWTVLYMIKSLISVFSRHCKLFLWKFIYTCLKNHMSSLKMYLYNKKWDRKSASKHTSNLSQNLPIRYFIKTK